MNILYLVGGCYDFGVDYLYDGLVRSGHAVIEWPLQPHYHRPGPDGQHWQDWTCEFTHPAHRLTDDSLAHMLQVGVFDLLIATTVRAQGRHMLQQFGPLCPRSTRLVTLDMNDHPVPKQVYTDLLTRPADAHFVREGAHPDSHALHLSFPETWACPPDPARRGVYFYGSDITLTRKALARLKLPPQENRIRLYPHKRLALSPKAYLQELRTAAIAVCPWGDGIDTNRFWEACASGCAVVAERWLFPMTDPFPRDTVCWFDRIAEAEFQLDCLLHNLTERRQRAENTYAHFLAHHSPLHRAAAVCRIAMR